MITLSGVSKTFNGSPALHALDLQIPAGKTTVLIGRSGSGKSTILRLLTGLLRADSGEVRFDDLRMTPENIESLRRRMGYVIQEGGLFPHLTGRSNVTLVARHLGWAEPKIAARIDELSDLVRLPREMLARFPAELSGGQRQRVSLDARLDARSIGAAAR